MSDLPKASHRGVLKLGTAELDCYVLEDGRRMIGSRATVRAMAGTQSGDLESIVAPLLVAENSPSQTGIEQKGRENKARFGGGKVAFRPPLRGSIVHGLTAETFCDICQAYVVALAAGTLKTDRQREIAMQCAVLAMAFMKVGLTAMIDEITGFQKVRAADDLQVKLAAYIATEARAWESTFPESFWAEMQRIWRPRRGNATHDPNVRPKYFGKIVKRIVYDAMDPDVTAYIQNHRPPSTRDQRWHQWLTSDFGVVKLRSHIRELERVMRTCTSSRQVYDQVALAFTKGPAQYPMHLTARA